MEYAYTQKKEWNNKKELDNKKMEEVQFKLEEKTRGAFIINDRDKRVAEMVVGISGNNLTVYHTEVDKELEGKGVAKQLLASMVEYARAHKYYVTPRCEYVHTQFKRHPELYRDVWEEAEKNK